MRENDRQIGGRRERERERERDESERGRESIQVKTRRREGRGDGGMRDTIMHRGRVGIGAGGRGG